MDSIKEKMPMIIAIIVAIALCGVAYYFLVYQQSNYYTQIDNSKIASIPETGGMKYEYTLDCYSENGKKKEIKFRTSRELKEDSYLKLEVMVTRGVKSWEEVQVNELPDKVKTALNIE